MMRRAPGLSNLVSLLLNPSLFTGGFFLVLVQRYEPAGRWRWLVGVTALLFATLVPLGILILLRAVGQLSDVEMRVRSERTRVYLYCAVSYGLGLLLFLAMGTAWPVTALMALLVPASLILALLNRWWKVSIHTTTLAGLAALAVALFGARATPFALLVPLAAWARWDAGAHTPGELLIGILLGAASAALGFETVRVLVGR